MGTESVHADLLSELRALRRPDGGFPTSRGGLSEVEPTAVAALALRDDHDAKAWLEARQGADGGFHDSDGRVEGPTSAALAALVLESATASRALRYAFAHRALPLPDARDPERRGWGWTSYTRSFVEPTSRVLIAAKWLAPSDRTAQSDAVALLEEWQCADGGWNHGVATVLDTKLPGYAQTTAIALIGLRDEPGAFVRDGLRFLRRTWAKEPGGLTTAQSLVAFRLHNVHREFSQTVAALERIAAGRSFLGSTVPLAWAALATGPDELLAPLRGRA
jgi:Prenyltransferase and squalene oxidase repeat